MAEERAVLVTEIGTTACSRQTEVENEQVSDLPWGHDATFHGDLAGGLAIRIYKRKQDTGRYGLDVRVPDSPLVRRLRRWVDSLQLRLDPGCTKERIQAVAASTVIPSSSVWSPGGRVRLAIRPSPYNLCHDSR